LGAILKSRSASTTSCFRGAIEASFKLELVWLCLVQILVFLVGYFGSGFFKVLSALKIMEFESENFGCESYLTFWFLLTEV